MSESCRKTQAMKNTKNRDADLMFSHAKLHQALQNYSLHSYKLVCERFDEENENMKNKVRENGFLSMRIEDDELKFYTCCCCLNWIYPFVSFIFFN
jgi:hypothetical protein